jgi:inorganic pyrophosphatase
MVNLFMSGQDITVPGYREYMRLTDIDPGRDCPSSVRMIVEIPKNSINKYEYDIELGVFRLDRTLYSPVHYPGDYGFIPGTLAEDDDPVDVIAMTDEPGTQGCMVEVRPLGMLEMIDTQEADLKILAVPAHNPRYEHFRNIDDVANHIRREVEHFFNIYKELEGKAVQTQGWRGLEDAYEAIRASRKRYLSRQSENITG